MRKLRHRVRHIIWVNLLLKAGCPNNYSAQAVSGAEQCRLDRSPARANLSGTVPRAREGLVKSLRCKSWHAMSPRAPPWNLLLHHIGASGQYINTSFGQHHSCTPTCSCFSTRSDGRIVRQASTEQATAIRGKLSRYALDRPTQNIASVPNIYSSLHPTTSVGSPPPAIAGP